jgi:hypothetical protein
MSLRLKRMSCRRLLAPLFVAIALAAVACSGSPAGNPRYPRRPPGCPLEIYNGLPDIKLYDDIGIAQVDCYLDESEITCLGRLRTEACRMGGDIVYNMPKKALRPVERGMVYRAQVAHTRAAKKPDDAPAPAPAAGAPVEPLLPASGAVPIAPAVDGGTP